MNTDDDLLVARRPRPVTDETRAEVARLHGLGIGRNEIGRIMGIAAGTVTKIAQAAGLDFDRTMTALAVEAQRIEMADERATISRMLLVQARKSLELMDAPHLLTNFNKDGAYDERLLPEATPEARRNHVVAAGVALQHHTALVKVDAGRDSEAARGLVGDLHDALLDMAKALEPEPETTQDALAEDVNA